MRAIPAFCLTIAVVGSGLTGCAVTGADGKRMGLRSDAFADYVAAVFRQQNEIATDLAFTLDDSDPNDPRFDRLEQAELDVLTACRGINELAERQRDNDPARGLGALKRARRVPDCERAAEAAAAVLAD